MCSCIIPTTTLDPLLHSDPVLCSLQRGETIVKSKREVERKRQRGRREANLNLSPLLMCCCIVPTTTVDPLLRSLQPGETTVKSKREVERKRQREEERSEPES
jgi:hypothetical protein